MEQEQRRSNFQIRILDKNLYNKEGLVFPGVCHITHPEIEIRISELSHRYAQGLDLWTGEPLPESTLEQMKGTNGKN